MDDACFMSVNSFRSSLYMTSAGSVLASLPSPDAERPLKWSRLSFRIVAI